MDLVLYVPDNHPPETGETVMTAFKAKYGRDQNLTRVSGTSLAEDNKRISESLACRSG